MGGNNKALLSINNRKFCEITINVVSEIFDEIIIVTNSPNDFNAFEKKCHIIPDILLNKGPLGGIYSALVHTKKEALFFVPCDMPFLNSQLIIDEIEAFSTMNCDAFVPRVGGNLEPIHSIFKKKLAEKLFFFLTSNQKFYIKSFLKLIDVKYYDLVENDFYRKVFTNINTPQELAHIEPESL
jgi:molybdopterin-guanine dinucleotide biosynthesis protein A